MAFKNPILNKRTTCDPTDPRTRAPLNTILRSLFKHRTQLNCISHIWKPRNHVQSTPIRLRGIRLNSCPRLPGESEWRLSAYKWFCCKRLYIVVIVKIQPKCSLKVVNKSRREIIILTIKWEKECIYTWKNAKSSTLTIHCMLSRNMLLPFTWLSTLICKDDWSRVQKNVIYIGSGLAFEQNMKLLCLIDTLSFIFV